MAVNLNHKRLQEKIHIAERRKTVATMLLAGKTYREMASELNCSLGTIHSDVHALLDEWRRSRLRRWLAGRSVS